MTYYWGASVKGRLFIDADGDNTEWNGATWHWEAGFEGAVVKLVDAHGVVVAETTTNHNGWYEFTGVPAGQYRVLFPKPEGYAFAQQDVGHWGADSDANADGSTVSFCVNWGDRVCQIDAGLRPVPPADDCVVTETLLHENFDGLHEPEQSGQVAGHTKWKLVKGAAFSNGHADGALAFKPVDLNGHHAGLFQFDIKANCVGNFEADGRYADSIAVQIRVDGGHWITIDTLRRDGHSDAFVGDQSGQRFGDDGYTTLTYLNENLPAGAHTVAFRIVSDITAGDEKIFVDNVKIIADKKTCDDCPEDATRIDFNDLEKGTIVSDQFEGVTITATANGGGRKIVVEAEHMGDWGFNRAHGAQASGGAFEKLRGHQGKLFADFNGPTGKYDVTIRVQDESDGQSRLWLVVGRDVREIVLDRDSDGAGSDRGGFSDFTLKDVHIARGQHYYIYAQKNGGEYVRIDKLTFESAAPTGNRAMIFDTDHITGGDHDLANGDGKVLILSEDGDSADPDDNAQGGQFHLDFDTPSDVSSFTLIDSEEGGTVVALDADGNQIGDVIELPRLADGAVAKITVDRDGVSRLVITLNGSGAIDDLCFKAEATPEPGSLSGRYFCDTNDNNLDDGQAVDPGEEGVLVTLLDANGNPVLDAAGAAVTTLTGPEGAYRFASLAPGVYGVRFTDPGLVLAGKALVAPNVGGDDAVDSDAIGTAADSVITNIIVSAGRDTPDNDGGVEKLNTPPIADADMGKLCAGESTTIDVLDGDTDADGDNLFITAVNGEAIAEGGSVTLGSGAVVSLAAGKLVYDLGGADDFDGLLIGQQAQDSFAYTVSDGRAEATASVDVTVCGAANLVETIDNAAPQLATYSIASITQGGRPPVTLRTEVTLDFADDAFDASLGGAAGPVTFTNGYCVDRDRAVNTGPSEALVYSTLGDLPDVNFDGGSVVDKEENLDLLNWVLNQGFEDSFSFGDIQSAIWELVDDLGGVDTDFATAGTQLSAGAQAIVDQALANGEGFAPSGADENFLGLIIQPFVEVNGVREANGQIYVVAVQLDPCECLI